MTRAAVTEVPEPTAVSAPYWAATRRRELCVQWCVTCDAGVHYPRVCCPRCLDTELDWRTMSGAATVYAHATHLPNDGAAYCVALVDLVEGVRLLTTIVEPDVYVGQAVHIAWRPLADGRNLPVFTTTNDEETHAPAP